jgi:hypothetical protein
MKMTFEVPNDIAVEFKRSVPFGKRSALIAEFMESSARKRQKLDLAACRKANELQKNDRALEQWEKFDDSE